MKTRPFLIALALFVGATSAALVTTDADARRLGGGGSAGIKRTLPPRQTTPPAQQAQPQPGQQPPAQQAAPTQNATAGAAMPATPPAAAPRRSWLGPVAGLAAGLGLAALASHFGFGEGLANIMTVLLLAAVAVFVLRFVISRMRAPAASAPAGLRYAGAPEPAWTRGNSTLGGGSGGASTPAAAPLAPAVPTVPTVPAGFDAAAFEKTAKLIFIRMQAANDAGDLQDLRAFTTPEMFAAARLDLQQRGGATQRTDVVQLAAEVVDVAHEDGRDVVSVRYSGLLREEAGGVAEPFDEVWHLVRPADGSREWAIAGIQQSAAACRVAPARRRARRLQFAACGARVDDEMATRPRLLAAAVPPKERHVLPL